MSAGAGAGRPGSLLLIIGHFWPDTPRLALSAREAGFTVHVTAPRSHRLSQLDWVHSQGTYSRLRPSRSVAQVLNARPFDLVIPTDDAAATAVFEAYLTGQLSEAALATVRRSLGDPGTFASRCARAAVAEVVAREGVRAPRTWEVRSERELPAIVAQSGLPAVVKADSSFAGHGVSIVGDAAAADAAYLTLSQPPRIPAALGRLLPKDDGTHPNRTRLWGRQRVTIQEFVPGEPATMAVAAWEGQVLGSVGVRVLGTLGARGPASVVEPLQHPEMEQAAAAVARGLRFSGLFGLDFILSPDRATASLLELNSRSVPISHLQLPWQPRPLLHLLAERVGVEPPPPRPPLPAEPIALFPQAWLASSDEPRRRYGELDLPADQGVIDVCLAPMVAGLSGRIVERTLRIGVRHQEP